MEQLTRSIKAERIVIDKKELAQYFMSLNLTYEDAVNLDINSEIIINAAIEFYGENNYYYRKNINRILKRNSNNLSGYFETITSTSNIDCTTPLNKIVVTEVNYSQELKGRISNESTKVTDDEIDFPITVKNIFDETYKKQEILEILPLGSINENINDSDHEKECRKSDEVTHFKRKFLCHVTEGEFFISLKEWADIYDEENNILKEGIYVFVLKTKIFQFVNNTCTINVKKYWFTKNRKYLTIYAYCGHVRCKTFVIKCNLSIHYDKGLLFKMNSSSHNFNHKFQLTRHVRGIERELVGQKYANEKPLCMLIDSTIKSESMLLRQNNLQKIKSRHVFKRIRSEKLEQLDRDDDDLIDLHLMRRKNRNYIQQTGEPMLVYIHSKEQMEMMKLGMRKSKNKKISVFLDATGTVIRQPNCIPDEKRILLYSLVIQIDRESSKNICSVSDFISARHDITAILGWLNNFKAYWLSHTNIWPIFDRIVTDFSMAEINAACLSFNQMPLINYINKTYDCIVDEIDCKNITHIALCCAHLMKILCTLINKKYDENQQKVKNLLKECFASVFNMKTKLEFELWFDNFVILTCSKYKGLSVECAENKLTELSLQILDKNFRKDTISESSENSYYAFLNEDDGISQYKKSKFYIEFDTRRNNILRLICNDGVEEANPYYNPDFLNDILERYVPYLPMWTSMVTADRSCNAPIESYFGILKNNVLNNNYRLKCSRFIRKQRKYILGVYKICKYDIDKNRCASKKRKKKVVCEENWSKKVRRNHSYYKGRYLNKISKVNDYPSDVVFRRHKLLSNHLIDDYKYYEKVRNTSYVVAKYDFIQRQADHLKCLFNDSFERLNTPEISGNQVNSWLDGNLIVFCLDIFNKDSLLPEFTVIGDEFSREIFLEKRHISPLFPELKKNSKIIMPFNQDNNHWVLMLIDLKKGQFTYMDPSGCNKGEDFMRRMIIFLEKYNKKFQRNINSNLSISVQHDIPQQQDAFNCGVFVIYYASCIMHGINPDINFDPIHYRTYLKKFLMTRSSNMKEVCLYCGSSEKSDDILLMCEMCLRFIHVKCIRHKDRSFEMPPKGVYFICEVCKFS